MVDFGGWDMPVEYSGGLIAEHLAVRAGVGLFDVSHMGEIRFSAPGALAAIQHITMNDASRLKDGQAHYSALLTPQGTFVDDILVHRLNQDDYLLVVNAGTKDKDYAWIRGQVGTRPLVQISDDSDSYSQLAVQGPRALETLQKLTKVDLPAIKNYWFTFGEVCGVPNVMIARTGYSGEDGFELYLPSDGPTTEKVWNALLEAGAEFGIRPCGLGARNTLRLEAGMPLYGHEISDTINPFESGHEHWLKLDTWKQTQLFYGGKRRRIRYKEVTQVYWRRGAGQIPLRLFVIAPTPYRKRKSSKLYYRQPAFLLSTDLRHSAPQLLQIYFDRWQIEVNHRDEKDTLGVGQAQLWNIDAVPKQPALVVAAYSALLLAALQAFGTERTQAYQALPKWRRKAHRPSCLDLVTLLRQEMMDHPECPQSLGFQLTDRALTLAADA